MHILIVKRGALGDVVRTAYFARALKERQGKGIRISWITSTDALPLLRFNPYIDDVWTSFEEAGPYVLDIVFSLDDERDALEGVASLCTHALRGAFLHQAGQPTYSADTAEWFDMGLLSRLGKDCADNLKKRNTRGHAQIFADIFGTPKPEPTFYGNPILESQVEGEFGENALYIGINAYAGGRWPSKELPLAEQEGLIDALLAWGRRMGWDLRVVLLGAGPDRKKNQDIAGRFGKEIQAAETDNSVLRLAAVVSKMHYLITSDSLPMHLAIAQRRPCLAFFCPTSAAEIDDFGLCRKLVSTGPDYCSYKPGADNTSITAERIMAALDHKWISLSASSEAVASDVRAGRELN